MCNYNNYDHHTFQHKKKLYSTVLHHTIIYTPTLLYNDH